MNRNILRILVILALFISSSAISVYAEEYGSFTFTLSGDNATITGYIGSDTTLTIPSTLGDSDQYSVVAIGNSAFSNQNGIERVIIPNTITTMGNDAFLNCNDNLIIECVDWNVPVMEYALANNIACQADNIIISKTGVLENLNSNYYNGNESNLVIPEGVIQIAGHNTFYDANFSSVSFPSTLQGIVGYGAFYQTNITSVTIPEGVTEIASDAFGYCFSLTEATLPASLETIKNNAFRSCTQLSSIIVDHNNPNYSAENGILYNKNKTKLLAYPSVSGTFTPENGVTEIDQYAFYQNPNIQGFKSNNINLIQDNAFNSCNNISSIYLAKEVTSVSSNAFYSNNSLQNIIITNDSINLNGYSFYSCNNIQNVWCNEGSNADSYFDGKAKRPINITGIPIGNKLIVGEIATLQATEDTNFTNINTYIASNITWSSSNNSIATVSETGIVTGVSSGSVTITASREDGLKTIVELDINEAVIITDVYNDTGYSNNDGITENETLYITGETYGNSSISLFVNSISVESKTSDNDGSFEFQNTFNEGTSSVYIEVTKNSNTYQSDIFTIVVDKTRPQVESYTPITNTTTVSLKPTVTAVINEPVKYINNNDLTTEFLNTVDANQNIISIRKNSLADCIVSDYTSQINDKSFTLTPKAILFPNTSYQLSIQRMKDYAGNILSQQITNFTTEDNKSLLNADNIELITDVVGMVYSEDSTNGCTVTLDFTKIDYEKDSVINDLINLQAETQTFELNRITGENHDNYAGVKLRIWADTEYDNYCLAYNSQYQQWTHKGSLLTDNTNKYVDIYPYVAAEFNDKWHKSGSNSTVAIAFYNSTSYTVKEFNLEINHDLTPPNNYSIDFDAQHINHNNENNFNFNVNNTEVYSTCTYTISDTDDTIADISQSVEVTDITTQFTNIDLSSLKDGTLSIKVTLKDQAGNIGEIVSRYITKKSSRMTTTISSVGPQTYLKEIPITITFDDNDSNFSNQMNDFSVDDISVTNGSVSYPNSVNTGVYECKIYPNDLYSESDLIVNIDEETCIDDYNNPNLAALPLTIHYIPNDPPQIDLYIDDNYNANIGEEIIIDLNNYFSDPDNDDLSYNFTSYNNTYATDPQLGELTDAIWRFTPSEEHLNITYNILFRATDNKTRPVSISFNLRMPDKIDFIITTTNVSTYNGNDGSIVVNVIDGSDSYEYSKDDGLSWQDSNIFNNLTADNYKIKVRNTEDYSTTSNTFNVTVTQPNKPYTPPAKPKEHEVEKALEKAKKNEQGIVKARIEQDELNYQGAYSQNIPSTYFGGEPKVLELKTPIASVNIPSNMLPEKIKGRIDFTIEDVKKETLSPKIKKIVGDKPLIDVNMQVNRRKVEWNNKDVKIEVAIPYTPTEQELNNENLSDCIIAYYLHPSGEIMPITLSEYDSKRGAVIFKTNHFSMYGVMVVDKMFNDIADVKWAHKAIASLTTRGVIKGSSAVTFSPKDNTTRADMVIFVNRFFGIKGTATDNYPDVIKDKYYYNEIAVAKQAGLLKDIAGEIFNPDQPISREDMMVLIKNALDYTGLTQSLTTDSGLKLSDFNDSSLVADYATNSVDFLISKKIVGGHNNMISPKNNTSRVDVVAILYKLLLALQK